MILSRRKTHFYIVIFLTCSLPLLLFIGLLWRPLIPTIDKKNDNLFALANFSAVGDDLKVIASENLAVNNISIVVERVQSSQGLQYLSFLPSQALQFSDVLVYLTGEDSASKTVSEEAILLGQLSGNSRRYFPVSKQNLKEPAYLLFYSLGQNKAISSISLPASLSHYPHNSP